MHNGRIKQVETSEYGVDLVVARARLRDDAVMVRVFEQLCKQFNGVESLALHIVLEGGVDLLDRSP